MSIGNLPSDYEDEITLNWKHFISIITITIFLWSYIFIESFRVWLNRQISFILGDWQLILSFIGIIVLTIGWYLIEAIALGILYFYMRVSEKLTKRSFNIFRWSLAFFFISLIISYKLFEYEFSDLMLWLTSFFLFCTFLGFYYIIYKIKKYAHRNNSNYEENVSVFPEEPSGFIEIDIKYILLFVLFIIPIIFILFTNQWGITDYLLNLWNLIFSNIYLKFLFYFILCITIFWKPLLLMFLILSNLSARLIRETAKRKINRTRLLLGIFIAVLLLSKNLIFLPLSDFEIQVYSLILSLVATVLSGYLLRKFGSGTQ